MPSLFNIVVVLGLLLLLVFLFRRDRSHKDAPATLPHFSLSYIMSFLKRRHDFLAWGFKATNQQLFQFKFLHVCQTFVSNDVSDASAPPVDHDID